MSREDKKQKGESRQDAKGADLESNAAECDGDDICEVHDIPIPPDGGWGWVIVMSSFLCNLIVDGIAYTFGVFLPKFVVYFNEGKGTVAWVGSLLAGVYLSCGPIVGALTNKFGCRTTCIMGSVVGMVAFALSTLSESVAMLMVTYGIIGGIGFGLIYLPAIVSVGYYFEKKRALATGIAVCGSGFGTFVFAPLASLLLQHYDWKGANLILAGIIFNCAVFGSLMRPLEAPKKKCKPLLQRMAEDKAAQLERGSLMGSQYFMVQLADGSYEKRLKVPVNVDPGVHSSFDLDELAGAHSAGRMPTISESKSDPANGDAAQQEKKEDKQMKNAQLKDNLEEDPKEGDKLLDELKAAAVLRGSRNSVSNGEASNLKRRSGACGSKDDVSSLSASKKDLAARPLARKDVLYTGSVTNLPEYQSQKSLASYRQSIVSIPKAVQAGKGGQGQKSRGGCCTCIPEATRKEISGLMDFSLMKDPVFLFLGVSNVFGMLGFYVPFVYIIDAATTKDIDEETAAFLLSIIGITNTVGRLISGYISDFPAVDSLFVTNVCIAVSGVAVFCVPFCSNYVGFCIASGVFGLFSSAFIALTSIVLVDLLGIAQLTNAFGLLCLLRGVAAIVGPPLAGSVFDMTQSYDVPFWLAGVFLFISSAISFMVPCVRRWAKRKEVALKAKTGGEMKQLKSSEDATRAVQT
ncbi:monocarboxylate transporter 14-like isoform X1 [Daphnia carinata]|uniref:monocarboxylate transporter 14-like isoform X1 n=1 Tax=Daphnia carinata TaxID=120202 RepID=UPI00257ED5EB|nr:monocarboxylate transporter 14-like isoform X1 [Daphnia carinata]